MKMFPTVTGVLCQAGLSVAIMEPVLRSCYKWVVTTCVISVLVKYWGFSRQLGKLMVCFGLHRRLADHRKDKTTQAS